VQNVHVHLINLQTLAIACFFMFRSQLDGVDRDIQEEVLLLRCNACCITRTHTQSFWLCYCLLPSVSQAPGPSRRGCPGGGAESALQDFTTITHKS
jgi:hypothetical protein